MVFRDSWNALRVAVAAATPLLDQMLRDLHDAEGHNHYAIGIERRVGRSRHVNSPGQAWGQGDFYVPGLASRGLSGPVPGRPDRYRRLFLEKAAEVEPRLLASLRKVNADDPKQLSAWGRRWLLSDRWALALAADTARWYAGNPNAEGWEFQGQGIFAGPFPFPNQGAAIWTFLSRSHLARASRLQGGRPGKSGARD